MTGEGSAVKAEIIFVGVMKSSGAVVDAIIVVPRSFLGSSLVKSLTASLTASFTADMVVS